MYALGMYVEDLKQVQDGELNCHKELEGKGRTRTHVSWNKVIVHDMLE